MKTVQLNGRIIKLYDSIDEMPIVNFQKYNKYLLIDSGIGSDINSVDEHVTKIAKFIKANDSRKALQELQNMRQNLYMINSEISPGHLAFAALIQSIDGKEITDLSDDNLKAILKQLNTAKQSWLMKLLTGLKKKVEAELETYFPEDFTNAKDKETYDKLKSRTLLVLEEVIQNTSKQEQVEIIDETIFAKYFPKSFVGQASAEIKYDKQFETACLLIAQKTGLDAKKMTVLQFYNALATIKQQAEAETKKYKRRNIR